MTNFEDELKAALRRKEPPLGFANRVMRRIERPRPAFRLRWAAWAVAAGLILSAGGLRYHSYQVERAQGERAKRQLLLALEITSEKLSLVQRKVDALSQRTIQ